MAPTMLEIGQRFGAWTVQAKAIVGWVCICDCGTIRTHETNTLTSGHTKSCGCRRGLGGLKLRKHGHSIGYTTTPEYMTWQNMIRRCNGSDLRSRKDYRDRGIRVCQRWLGDEGFSNFLSDMGYRPSPDHSIDRIKNDLGYEPENCRWATAEQQAQNTRRNVFVEIDGRRQCLASWCRELGINPITVRCRMSKQKMSALDALLTPVARMRDV